MSVRVNSHPDWGRCDVRSTEWFGFKNRVLVVYVATPEGVIGFLYRVRAS